VAVGGAEAAKKVEHLARFRDRVTNIAKLIGQPLELAAVFMDGEISLLHAPELSFEEDGSLEFVVTKVTFNIRPKGEGSDVRFVDEIEDIGGNGGVYPIDNAAVDLSPVSSALGDWRWRADMVLKAKLAKNRIETAAPLAILGGGVIEDDENVIADVHRLDDGSHGWLWRLGVIEFAIRRGSRGVDW
jgi:hypothetical protein